MLTNCDQATRRELYSGRHCLELTMSNLSCAQAAREVTGDTQARLVHNPYTQAPSTDASVMCRHFGLGRCLCNVSTTSRRHCSKLTTVLAAARGLPATFSMGRGAQHPDKGADLRNLHLGVVDL